MSSTDPTFIRAAQEHARKVPKTPANMDDAALESMQVGKENRLNLLKQRKGTKQARTFRKQKMENKEKDWNMIRDMAKAGEVARYLFREQMSKNGMSMPSLLPGPVFPPEGVEGRGGGGGSFKYPASGKPGLKYRKPFI